MRGALYTPKGTGVPWWKRLVCRVKGHDAYRVTGTFLVKCDRCEAFANLRLMAAPLCEQCLGRPPMDAETGNPVEGYCAECDTEYTKNPWSSSNWSGKE